MCARRSRYFARLTSVFVFSSPVMPFPYTIVCQIMSMRSLCVCARLLRYGSRCGKGKLCICVLYRTVSYCSIWINRISSFSSSLVFRSSTSSFVNRRNVANATIVTIIFSSVDASTSTIPSRFFFSLAFHLPSFFSYHFHHYLHLPVVRLLKRTASQHRQLELEIFSEAEAASTAATTKYLCIVELVIVSWRCCLVCISFVRSRSSICRHFFYSLFSTLNISKCRFDFFSLSLLL